MAFLNATSQFRKIVGKMVSYFEDEFICVFFYLTNVIETENSNCLNKDNFSGLNHRHKEVVTWSIDRFYTILIA